MFVGDFTINSGKIRVTDPCYTRDTWCSGVLENCKVGDWRAYAIYYDMGMWGNRIAKLIIVHSSKPSYNFVDNWIKTEFEAGVDSGQCGFFDDALYPEDVGEYMDPSSFYSKACELTYNEAQGFTAGVMSFGAVASSGFGDGGYDCFIQKNESGEIIAAQIVFIPEEDLSDEPENELEDDEDKDYAW